MNYVQTGSETGKQMAQKRLLSSLATCGLVPAWDISFTDIRAPVLPPSFQISHLRQL